MAQIMWLEFGERDPSKNYSRLMEIASELGHTISKYGFDYDRPKESLDGFMTALRTADAYLVPDPVQVADPGILAPLHERIKAGTRALFTVNHRNSNERDRTDLDMVLAPFDMSPADIRIRPDTGYEVRLKRTVTGFRESELLRGVDEITLSGPNAILYQMDSTPVLVIDGEGTDGTIAPYTLGDFLYIEPLPTGRLDPRDLFGLRKLAPYVVWRDPDGPGAALGIYGFEPFINPCDTMAGRAPGIEANELLARRMLEFLTSGQRLPAPDLRTLCDQAEIHLADTIRLVCQWTGPGWWDRLVPEKVRAECEARRAHDRNGLPPAAFMTIINMKVILEKNMALFDIVFRETDLGETKRERLSWINTLNDVRNVLMHALKAHIGGITPGTSDRAALESAARISQGLLTAARTLGTPG